MKSFLFVSVIAAIIAAALSQNVTEQGENGMQTENNGEGQENQGNNFPPRGPPHRGPHHRGPHPRGPPPCFPGGPPPPPPGLNITAQDWDNNGDSSGKMKRDVENNDSMGYPMDRPGPHGGPRGHHGPHGRHGPHRFPPHCGNATTDGMSNTTTAGTDTATMTDSAK